MHSNRMLRTILTLGTCALQPLVVSAQAPLAEKMDAIAANADPLPERERLTRLLEALWEWQVEEFPEFATMTGHPGRHIRWTDVSEEAYARREAVSPRVLRALETIDREALDERARLEYDLVRRSLRQEIEGQRFPGEYLPLNQMDGVQQEPVRVLGQMPTATVGDYEDILARLRALPAYVQQTIELMEAGLARGLTPPGITLRDVPQQVRNLLPEDPAESPLLTPFDRFPESIPAAERERLRAEAVRIMASEVAPAYERLHAFLVERYLPGARSSIALSALPEGEDWYAHNVRTMTTTELTPREIHEIGLREVARIRGEMEEVKRETGFEGALEEFFEHLRTDPKFFHTSAEELLQGYRDIAKRADPELVKLFGTLPRLPYGVLPVPAHSEKSQPTAYYQLGSLDAGRAAYFYANTYDLDSRPKWEMEALTLHEAVPGHHLQIAIAQERPEAHRLVRYLFYTAFVEGWGLYAESLGPEMGFYEDPYSRFGQLTYEMWRAIRLVVDTGMHSLGWTRQQAIDYFTANAGKAEHDIVVEVDRYIVWPGQALAYKIGELKIKELRAFSEDALGEEFDIREFHDVVLGSGMVPLDVLEANVRAWVQAEQDPA